MTREEAAKIIADYDVYGCGYCHQGGDEVPEAFSMAIEALKAQEPRALTKACVTCKHLNAGSNEIDGWYRCRILRREVYPEFYCAYYEWSDEHAAD